MRFKKLQSVLTKLVNIDDTLFKTLRQTFRLRWYALYTSYRLGEYPLPALLARSHDTCFVKTNVFYALPKGKPQKRIQKIQKWMAGTLASYIDTFIFLRIL